MNEHRLQLAFHWSQERRYDFMIPNCYFNGWEMDICAFRKGSRYIEEIEIKTSASDFHNDFKKTVHRRGLKHELLRDGKLASNYFAFLVPADLFDTLWEGQHFPSYAGIYVARMSEPRPHRRGFLSVECRRSPKLLHKTKPTESLCFKMARKTTFRYWRELHGNQKRRDDGKG